MKKLLHVSSLLCLLFLGGCSTLIPSIKTEQFQEYLENTYGTDRGFTITWENNAHWGELNYGTVCFTADDLDGKEFVVYGMFDSKGNPFFDDDYMEVKYEDQLRDYYASYFDSYLNNTDFFYKADVDEPYNDGYSFPIVSFEEYLKLVSERKIYIEIKGNVSGINIDTLKSQVTDIIKSENLSNISQLDLVADDLDIGRITLYQKGDANK